MDSGVATHGRDPGISPRVGLGWVQAVVLGAVTAGIRLVATLRTGGFTATHVYDDAVYFTSAVRFVHGSWPYRDFVLLHPPGMTLLLSPFAWLAGPIGDAHAFILARLVIMGAAGLTAVLVASLAAERGRFAGWVAGLTYALFSSSVFAGSTLFMEGVSSLVAVSALILLTGRRSSTPSWQRVVAAGLLLGLLPVLKVWNAPLALVILSSGGRSRWLLAGGSALVSFTALVGPFLVRDPGALWRMVVTVQLGRPRYAVDPLARFGNLFGYASGGSTTLEVEGVRLAATLAALALVVGILAICLRSGVAPVFPALFLVSAGLVLSAPLGLGNYGELAAPWLAVLAGLAAASSTGGGRGRARLIVAASLVWLVLLSPGAARHVGRPLPVAWLNEQLVGARCVVTDDPVVLIATNRLSGQLGGDCPEVWVDVSGRSYDDASDGNPDRTRNQVWQRVVHAYLTSADASVTCRPSTGLSDETRRRLRPARTGHLDPCSVYRFSPPP